MRLCVIVTSGDELIARWGECGVELDNVNVRGRAACVVVMYGDVVVECGW